MRLSFNSNMVQLRDKEDEFSKEKEVGFNSNMVQLRDEELGRDDVFVTTFQFQYGSIKSQLLLMGQTVR